MARPSSYNPGVHPIVAEAKKRDGWTDAQLAEHFGISVAALTRWKKRYEEFRAAFEKGRDFVDIQVENALLKRALGYEYEEVETETVEVDGKSQRKKVREVKKQVAPDTGAAIFWLKNRRPMHWRDTLHQEVTGADGQPLIPDAAAVLEDRIAAILARRRPESGDRQPDE